MRSRLPVTEEAPFLTAVSYVVYLGDVLWEGATKPEGWTTFHTQVLHSFSAHPHPLTSQETQARPHLISGGILGLLPCILVVIWTVQGGQVIAVVLVISGWLVGVDRLQSPAVL